jgi:hypothetical protein
LIDSARVEKRPATRADLIMKFGKVPDFTVRAWVWTLDDKVLTLAGWFVTGRVILVFSDMFLDSAPAVGVFRRARDFMATVPSPAICEGSDASRRFLEALGWRHVGTAVGGKEIFLWER